ncbi:universal stress protein [Streptomyces sp. SAI-041]|uniref:universal stress protein n=1 Tax=Streptomyces sp. SAI-041 TaxID=2940548 RepID=UPI0024760690|nr:universal stress protein [Streptomyces sp. SAI-041]MDH6547053.1 nucleotide-binding universal stress UspA family protein [Streptomyces sp. SAI-041]
MLRPVVVGLDGSTRSLAAAGWAAREALRRGLPLQVVQAWEGVTAPCDTEQPELNGPRCLARSMLGDAADRLRETYPQLSLSTRHITGAATDVLVAVGAEAELLVLGSRAVSGVGGFLAGSVTQVVVGHVARPVVLVRALETLADEHLADAEGLASTHTPYRGVVVGVDPGHPCEEVLSFAFESAALRAAPLSVVHAWRLPYVQAAAVARAHRAVAASSARALSAAVAAWREKFPAVEVRELVLEARPSRALQVAAQDAGLLVVGRRIRTGRLGTRTGSVAHSAMHHAGCPVAVVAHE